ncbi:MAG TPA: Gfo/Idh/MocA family oxidoreductase [Pirellulales bacterium]|jgi:predicted dehydrogenase|nr:Gfo/Idh/MocA family oxidoreductase [Pirellulales bacterium]
MSHLNRRQFLRTSAAASTTFGLVTIAGTKASGRVIGANDTIRIGVAGIRGRGQSHIDAFSKNGAENRVAITYLIDPDTRLFQSRTAHVEKNGGSPPKCVKDIREALDDQNLDAVSVATCNHWHSLITIWACQAGKDVYVEKPISHNVFEGRKCVEAAEKYKRIVQHGTQQRSSEGRAREIAALQSGKYGKLTVSKAYACKPRWSIGTKPITAPPAELDFNIWLGPAPEQSYHGNLVPYNWHWFWDTGNGEIGNQGVHEMDVARWAIKDSNLPKSVWSLGGRFTPSATGLTDQGQTPNMQMAVFDFGDALLVFEVRGLVGNKQKGDVPSKVKNEFYTTEGVIRDGKFYRGGQGDGEPVSGPEVHVTPGGPFGSFLQAVRSRKKEEVNADALTAHYSAALCHLGNISYRLGEPVPFEKSSGKLGDNHQVIESFDALRDNLKAVGLNLAETTYSVGPKLAFDPAAERFTGDRADAANAMLSRPYRAPFVVPEQV